MRPWNKLGWQGKLRRVYYTVKGYVIGDYRRGGIVGVYHWVRCHTWNRYHLIDIRGEGEYDWGWIDRDHAMYLACFRILRDFVELEDPRVGLRTVDDYCTEHTSQEEREHLNNGQLAGEREIRALYDWWTHDRKVEHDEMDALVREGDCKDVFGPKDERGYSTLNFEYAPGGKERWDLYMKRSDELEKKDDEMLDRLIRVRHHMWT